ncbi:MAG: Mov34/MPN/PAD-1 family protein, partial [Archaeoglobaceae archaeon]
MKIKGDLLKAVLEAARDAYPYEFIALLTGEKGVISELVFLPSLSGEESALIHLDMLPLGFKIYGTVHSHPSPCCEPSEEDLFFFTKFGSVHIIV